MKFLIDMPLSPSLAIWLRGIGHDAVHASQIGLARSTDIEILQLAALEGRIVVTADLDYPRLVALSGSSSPSLILFRGGDWSEREVTEKTEALLHRFTEDELRQSLFVVDRHRTRRRRLPI